MAILPVGKNVPLNLDPKGHLGRDIHTLKNISNGVIKVDPGNRKMRIKLFCAAVNYTGGAGQATKHLTGAGNDALTVTLTLSAGREPTAVAIVNGGGGYAVNDTFTVVDATGTGAVFTVTAVAAGAVTAATYVANSATASPVDPSFFFVAGKFNVQIGGTTPHQIDPAYYVMLAQARELEVPLGELPINFTDPRANLLADNDTNSWDTFGAKNMQINYAINPNCVKATLTGSEEFDNRRNSYVSNGQTYLFNNPIKFVQQTIALNAGAVTPINNLTVFGRLKRLWILGATPGNITSLEIWANGLQRTEGPIANLLQFYRDYDYWFGQPEYQPSGRGTSNLLQSAYNPFTAFDAAYISDIDERPGDALDVSQSLIVKIGSNVAQNATCIIECLPGGFA